MTVAEYLHALNDFVRLQVQKIDYETLPFQIFILVVCFIIVPLFVISIRRYKRSQRMQDWRHAAPRVLGQKLFALISDSVRETISSDRGRFQGEHERLMQSRVYCELCIDYAFMVNVGIKGLLEDDALEERVGEFVKNYIYPSVLCHMDLSIDDLQNERERLNARFFEYQSLHSSNLSSVVIPLAQVMAENFDEEGKASEDDVNEMITEICHVINEVPILLYKFKYQEGSVLL